MAATTPAKEPSVKELKSLLKSQGVDVRGCSEKRDLLALASKLPPERDLSAVRRAIADAMYDPGHDDGSFAPLLIRFSWHCCGTFDKTTGTGGSNGGTMRFDAEQADPENSGLAKARELLDRIHEQFPWLSKADLYVLAGTVAIEVAGGPSIPFATGRRDYTAAQAEARYGGLRCPFGDGKFNPGGSRLPAADLGPDLAAPPGAPPHVKEAPTIAAMRGTFERLGFDDKETVCLIILGHQFGRCHPTTSGYTGSWYGFGPAEWNVYGPGGLGYITIYGPMGWRGFEEVRTPEGRRQWNNTMFGRRDPPPFMMLPVDMALGWDPVYKQHVAWYDRHRNEFRRDAGELWKRLIELGCDGILTPEKNPPTRP